MRPALLAAFAAAVIVAPVMTMAQPASPPAQEETAPSVTPAPESAPPATAPETTAPPDTAAPALDAARSGRAARSMNRRRLCRQEARRKGLRGADAQNDAAVCLAEARLECTKQAAAQNLDRGARNAFIRTCLGMPERGSGRERRERRPRREPQ